jgi:RNA polymerase sigma factor (sigma-70 family)
MQTVAVEPTEEIGAATLAPRFDEFYDDEYGALIRLGYVLTGSHGTAEELVQETMLRVYRNWSKVASYEKPGAWARRVLCNLATSRGRRLTAEAKAMVRFRGRVEAPEPRAEVAELWVALRKLPTRQAQALALFYVEDLPLTEIAALLECPEGTVKALLHRGRKTLAEQLGEATEEMQEPQ